MLKRLAHHLARNAIAWLALFVALGGASYAAIKLPANSVGSRQIKRNAVTSSKIKRNAVTSSRVKDRSLLASDFKAGQIPTGQRGATGAIGPAGPKGDTGPGGPANATEGVGDGPTPANRGTATTLATLNGPPPRAYVITPNTAGPSTRPHHPD